MVHYNQLLQVNLEPMEGYPLSPVQQPLGPEFYIMI